MRRFTHALLVPILPMPTGVKIHPHLLVLEHSTASFPLLRLTPSFVAFPPSPPFSFIILPA